MLTLERMTQAGIRCSTQNQASRRIRRSKPNLGPLMQATVPTPATAAQLAASITFLPSDDGTMSTPPSSRRPAAGRHCRGAAPRQGDDGGRSVSPGVVRSLLCSHSAGKSRLVNLMMRFYELDAGRNARRRGRQPCAPAYSYRGRDPGGARASYFRLTSHATERIC